MNLAQVDAGLEEMRGVRMPQRVNMSVLVHPGRFQGVPKRLLNGVQRHGLVGVGAVRAAAVDAGE